ncbi:hypothetical protein ACFL6I_22775 [candidate division KSB1 bacterium]
MLKKDSYVFGILIGMFLPCLFIFLFYLIGMSFEGIANRSKFFTIQSQILFGIAANVIPIRYYFISLKFDKTGRGVLLMTFLMVIVFFSFDLDNLFKI